MKSVSVRLIERFHDLVASVYLYNEEQGFLSLERLLGVFESKFPQEEGILTAVRKHIQDERKHHRLFQGYFQRVGRAPFSIGKESGYCDLFVERLFGQTLIELNPKEFLDDETRFYRLCRAIMMIEARGMRQVSSLLRNSLIQKNETLWRIFKIVEHDEPSHTFPYEAWLKERGESLPSLRERAADLSVHSILLYWRLPLLYLDWSLERAR